jgi:hypothetical protein
MSLMGLKLYILTNKVDTLTASCAVKSSNLVTLRASFEDAERESKRLNKIVVDKSLELDKWRSKPDVVKYKTIYKWLPAGIDIKKDDCETLKNTISAIRHIEF